MPLAPQLHAVHAEVRGTDKRPAVDDVDAKRYQRVRLAPTVHAEVWCVHCVAICSIRRTDHGLDQSSRSYMSYVVNACRLPHNSAPLTLRCGACIALSCVQYKPHVGEQRSRSICKSPTDPLHSRVSTRVACPTTHTLRYGACITLSYIAHGTDRRSQPHALDLPGRACRFLPCMFYG